MKPKFFQHQYYGIKLFFFPTISIIILPSHLSILWNKKHMTYELWEEESTMVLVAFLLMNSCEIYKSILQSQHYPFSREITSSISTPLKLRAYEVVWYIFHIRTYSAKAITHTSKLILQQLETWKDMLKLERKKDSWNSKTNFIIYCKNRNKKAP